MDNYSPLVYKKINFEIHFKNMNNKKGEIDYNIKNYQNPKIFYDLNTKMLIQINDDNIKIYNKNATNLKKNLNLKLLK